jgi:AmmeMemoRadiSam system protein A
MELSDPQRKVLLDIVRSTIRAALQKNLPQQVIDDDPILNQPAGCFVSLHALFDHRLRGCVGQLEARESLIAAVQHSARSVLHDPRFVNSPVRLEELPELEIELSVISPMQPANSCMDFEPLDDGIYLTIGNRGGCFLPQVARETGWSREQLLERLCEEKLGVPKNLWKDESARLLKFQTLIVGPEPFEPR